MRRKVLLVAILIVAILLQSVMPFTMVYATTGVEITLNSNLYKAVKAQLHEQGIVADYKDANGLITISQAELDKVTSLNLENKEIDDLTGLNAFSKVTTLNLHANKLTVDSNLSVLDGLPLIDLDLSSNQLESVKSITNFKNIAKADITNQIITKREIISVDDSEDAESRTKQVTVELPDILLEDGNQVNPNWLTRTINADDDNYSPEIDFENSIPYGSSKLVLNVARGELSSYKVLKGLLKVEIKVNDSTSKLDKTRVTVYYAITNSEETGIAFNDENLYKAVREQLKDMQTINEELQETTGKKVIEDEVETIVPSNHRKLYSREYEEALILVIDTNDIINKIPSLILNDKKIKDLTGIEQFVGLKSELNVSYNYIDTIDKIVELEENKAIKEEKTRAKYQKFLTQLIEQVNIYNEQQEIIKTAEEKYEKANKELQTMLENNATGDVLAEKQTEINGYLREKGEAQTKSDASLVLIYKSEEEELYKIYEKEYRLVSLLPNNITYISYEKINNSDLSTLKNYSLSIMDKIATLEKNNALTPLEKSFIELALSGLGDNYNLPFKKKKLVEKLVIENGETNVEEVEEEIENPFSEYFEEIKKDETLNIEHYKFFIYLFKYIDAISQVDNYCLIESTFNNKTYDDNLIKEARKDIKSYYAENDIDTYFYDDLEYSIDNDYLTGYNFDIVTPDLTIINLDLDEYIPENYKDILAQKLAIVTSEDINTYITLPRIQKLNLEDNKVRTLEKIETLSKLKELNAWKNMIDNISNVEWTTFNNLQVLNLGYNQISDISLLNDVYTLRDLNLSYNLLEGRFTFNLINKKNLKNADFSHNQYNDIKYVNDQYILKAMGYDGNYDGVADGLTVPEYLTTAGITLNFQYQTLEMETTIVKSQDEFVEFDLPLIFRQVEDMDNARTSFGVDSLGGLVEPEGTTVKLRVPDVGTYKAVVSILGRHGYYPNEPYSTKGIGYGTTCTIKYTVVDSTPVVVPDDPTQPNNPQNPTNPIDPNNSNAPEYGYAVTGDLVSVCTPEITLEQFKERLVDLSKYNVTITQNKSETKICTGSVATITDNNDTEYAILEVVVKGDINGDGVVDAIDSGIIRGVINDTRELDGVYQKAADVNSDGKIDSQDSKLILRYRADRITSFED